MCGYESFVMTITLKNVKSLMVGSKHCVNLIHLSLQLLYGKYVFESFVMAITLKMLKV